MLTSAALGFQIVAVLAGALGSSPSSTLQRDVAHVFATYHQLTDQGYAYRYYAPEPGPTPVVTATIDFSDGRPQRHLRLPARGVVPRLRYQRQLALANHLYVDFDAARSATGDGSQSHWARSYAKHLAKQYPGCARVTVLAQMHLIPDPARIREELERPGAKPVDLDAEEFYTVPERIGDFACDAF